MCEETALAAAGPDGEHQMCFESIASTNAMPPSLYRRDTDTSSSALRDAFTPHPHEQVLTLYILAAFIGVASAIFALPRRFAILLHPWVLLVTVVHECGHAVFVILTGGRVFTININLSASGDTIWLPRKGRILSRREYFVWAAGYPFAGLIGAYLVFSGFSILASKIATIVLAFFLLLALIFVTKDIVSVPTILFAMLIPIPLWLLEHARFLRFYILWSGAVMVVYNLFLCTLSLVIDIRKGSDAEVFAFLLGGSPRVWGFLWTLLCFLFFAVAVLGGILAVSTYILGSTRRQASLKARTVSSNAEPAIEGRRPFLANLRGLFQHGGSISWSTAPPYQPLTKKYV